MKEFHPDAWIKQAVDMGFTAAVALDPARLKAEAHVRAMCRDDKCGAYGKNWSCPPACGSLEECGTRMEHYTSGILLQTVGTLDKTIDTRGYMRTEQRHQQLFMEYAQLLRNDFPEALCLGAGGCRICNQCAYPQPCRFPEKMLSSMEAYGLFVTQVCRDHDLPYHYGEKTVTFTACILV